MRGVELTRESFVENIPTFVVRGLIKGGRTLSTFEDLGLEADGSLNDMAFDGVTDYADGEFVLFYQSKRFNDEADADVQAPELDGLYRITTIGSPHNDPLFERVGTSASLFEITDGNRYGGTFWKNLTLPTGYILNVSPFVLEELQELET